MNSQIRYIVFLLTLLIKTSFVALGQQDISGNILDKTNSNPIVGVTIQLYNSKDSILSSTSSVINGYYTFRNIGNGKYQLKTNHLGYNKTTLEIQVLEKSVFQNITLEPSEIGIEEVEITITQAIKMKGDTMEFDSKNFATRENADADELVSQIPGIQIDEEGNVTAHGENVSRIIVDGKEFFSADPKIALKNLPADIIAKIQLIDEKSEQSRFSGFDDGKRNKVINIITKPDRKRGYFGKSTLGKGNADKFGLSAALNRFNNDLKYAINVMANNINETNFAEQGRGGVRRGNNNTDRGLSETYAVAGNYSNTFLNKKLEFNADYNFKSLNTLTNTLSNIEYLSDNQANQFRNQNQNSDNLSKEHQFESRIKWNIDSTNRIDFAPNFKYSQTIRENSTHFTTKIDEAPINTSDRSNSATSDNFSIGGNLTYMHRFKNKNGRTISLNVSGNKNSNDALGLNLAITSYFRNETLNRIDTNNNQSFTHGYGSNLNSKIAFTESLSQHSRLQANYNFRTNNSYSDRDTYEFLAETGNLGDLRERLSNEFRNDYNYHSTGVSYTFSKKDSLRIQIGANYQHGVRNNNRTVPITLKTVADFSSFHPEFAFNYKLPKDRSIEFNYNTQTNTPNINQLQDFVNNQNELRITNGNPNLKQEYVHNFRFQYKNINKTSGRTLTTNLIFEYINDKIINTVLMTDTSMMLFDDVRLGAGGQYIVPMNANGAYNFRATNSLGLPIKKLKINLNSFSRVYFNNELAMINEEMMNNLNYGFSQSIGFNSNFSKKFIVGIHYQIDARNAKSPLSEVKNYNTLNHRINNNLTWELFNKLVFNSTFMYLYNDGILNSPAIETAIWNASIGYKLLNKKNAEIAFKGFDLLNKAQNINRRLTENAITDVTSNTLNRYFLLSLTYNLRHFGGK